MIGKIGSKILAVFILLEGQVSASVNDPVLSYTLASLNGTSQVIKINPNYIDNQLVISSLRDTIRISDFTDLDQPIKKLNNNFLEIIYRVRVGSDIKVRHALILCIVDNKIQQAFHATSWSSYDLDLVYNEKADSLKLFDEHGLLSLKFDLIGEDKNNFRLNVRIHDEVKSKRDPQTNHNYDRQVSLLFDSEKGVFYCKKEDISQYFTIYDPKTQTETKRYIMGAFPVITLDRISYYWIRGEWYEKEKKEYLIKYSYK